MQSDILKSIEKANRTTFESVKRLGEINARALQRLSEAQLAAATDCLEGGVKQAQLMGEVKGFNDVVSGQSRILGELNEKLVGHAKKSADILIETRGELTAWVEDGLKAAGETPLAKSVAKPAAKTGKAA